MSSARIIEDEVKALAKKTDRSCNTEILRLHDDTIDGKELSENFGRIGHVRVSTADEHRDLGTKSDALDIGPEFQIKR